MCIFCGWWFEPAGFIRSTISATLSHTGSFAFGLFLCLLVLYFNFGCAFCFLLCSLRKKAADTGSLLTHFICYRFWSMKQKERNCIIHAWNDS